MMSAKSPQKDIYCPINKPGKEGARSCAKGLLAKAMERETVKEDESEVELGYSVDEIEQAIYNAFVSRETYLTKIAKVALHLSLFTRTGRVSYTFQNAIFDRKSSSYYRGNRPDDFDAEDDDYMTWLVTRATNEEIFPELYMSMPQYIMRLDQEQFETIMNLEHDAILAGLNFVVRQCCDSKVCSASEINISYDSELFKSGTPFESAARSICVVRKIQSWIPPDSDIYIPNSTPYRERIIQSEFTSAEQQTINREKVKEEQGQYMPRNSGLQGKSPVSSIERITKEKSTLENSTSYHASDPDTGMDSYMKKVLAEQNRKRYESQPSTRAINRNFDVSGNVLCLNTDNLIHNLAILTPGNILELPFAGELIDSQILADMQEKYRIEIAMRRYYLDSLYLE